MNINIEIPPDLYDQARQIAESQHVSIDDVLASAFSDQLANLHRLKQKASRGNREKFLSLLERVRDIEPYGYDRL